MERIEAMTYKLNLPRSVLIHLVFHVSILKPFKGDAYEPYIPLLLLTNENGPLLQPIMVLCSRMIIQNN